MDSSSIRPTPSSGDRLAVIRPPLPIHLVVLAGLGLGICVGYGCILGVPIGRQFSYALAFAIAPVLMGAVVALRLPVVTRRSGAVHAWVSVAAALIAACAVGVALGWLDAAEWQRSRAHFGELTYGDRILTIREGSSPSQFGQLRALADIDLGSGRTAAVEVTHADGLSLRFGQRVVVTGRTSPVRVVRPTHLAKGVVGRVSISERGSESARVSWPGDLVGRLARVRARLAVAISRLSIEEEGRALLAGLLLGERAGVRVAGLEEPFRAAGVSHILSVSGSHLAVVAGAVMAVARVGGIGRAGASVAVVLFAMLFTLLTGGEPATLRAWCMLVAAAVVHHGGRRTDGLAAVGVAGTGLLLADSGLVFAVGFWLSVSAVVGLVLLTRLAIRWIGDLTGGGRVSRLFAVPMAATLAAQSSTLPIAAVVFGTVSQVAPLANLAVVPLTAIAIVVGLAGSALHLAGLPGNAVLMVAATVSGWAARCTSVLSSIPGAELTLGSSGARWCAALLSAVCLAAVYIGWPQPGPMPSALTLGAGSAPSGPTYRRQRLTRGQRAPAVTSSLVLIALCAAMWFAPSLGIGSRVVFLDVGQGDAVLVQSRGRSVLIDGGPDGAALRWELLMAGCLRVDAVVATHDHEDHVAGLQVLAEQVGGPPEALYCASGAERSSVLRQLSARYGSGLSPLTAGQTIRIGDLGARVLGPNRPVSDAGANDSCLVLAIHRFDSRHAGSLQDGVLVAGDAEAEATARAVRIAGLTRVAVLKVGHHGSADAVSATLLEALDPSLAVISVGEGNRYGHPTIETLGILERHKVPVRRTDIDGRVVVRF